MKLREMELQSKSKQRPQCPTDGSVTVEVVYII